MRSLVNGESMAKTRILQECMRSGQKKTRTRGNTLVLIVAVMAILIAILLFALGYTRLVGSNQEQKTAIEAASLAAAKEISRIVINDPNFGFISLSDAAPVGKSTAAGDNYFMLDRSAHQPLAGCAAQPLCGRRA